MYYLTYDGVRVSSIEVRRNEHGLFHVQVKSGIKHLPLLFEHKEQCYALLATLSLLDLEVLSFSVEYMEV